MYDYIVLTAAITRPDLHRRVFPGHLELIGAARVKWLINVDDVGTGASVAETIAQLERLLLPAENVDVEFLRSVGGGCFFQAARRLAERARELLDECHTGVVWLEDDWVCPRRTPFERLLSHLRSHLARDRLGRRIGRCPGDLAEKQVLLERRRQAGPDQRWFVSLVPRSRVSFNPGIWSKALAETALIGPLLRWPPDTVDDPESLCADPLNEPDAYRQLTVLLDARFQDAGRRWSATSGLRKWDKLPAAIRQNGSVTYARGPGAVCAGEALAARLCGWVVIPGNLLGFAPALVARIHTSDGVPTVRLLGVPYLSVELVISGEGAAELYLHRLQRWARTYPFKPLAGSLCWRVQDPLVLEVTGPGYRFTSEVTHVMPSRALWMGPLQAVAGLVLWARSLRAALRRLDAENPARSGE